MLSLALTLGCDNGNGPQPEDCSNNHLLAGPWLAVPERYAEWGANYLVFDGEGTITDAGGIGNSTPPGTYCVRADRTGTLQFTYPNHREATATFRLTSETSAAGSFISPSGDESRAVMNAVSDPARMQGAWAGTLNVFGESFACTFQVDEAGSVIEFSGLPEPVTGRAYADETGLAVAMFRTAHPGAYREFFLHIGSVAGDVWSGQFQIDSSGGDGTFLLTRGGPPSARSEAGR